MILGTITLAPGQIGYHDNLSGIHLTTAFPTVKVSYGANTENLKRDVKMGRIRLLSGTLSTIVTHNDYKIRPAFQRPIDASPVKPIKKEEVKTNNKSETKKPVEKKTVKKTVKKENKSAELKIESKTEIKTPKISVKKEDKTKTVKNEEKNIENDSKKNVTESTENVWKNVTDKK